MSSLPNRQHAVNESADQPRTPAGDAFSALTVQMIRLHGYLEVVGDTLARPVGLTTARWQVLASVESGPSTVAGIARGLALARQSVQRVADLLVDEGLAAYEENPAHRRAKLLAITATGRDALAVIQAGQRVWANAVGAEVGEERLRRANDTLTALIAAIVKQPPFGGPRDPDDDG